MTDALTIYRQFDQIESAALALQQSGYFPDVKSKQQAIVKVMAGAELGLPPFASMTGIHIIKGELVFGANAMATLVKNDPRYDFTLEKCDNNECALAWYENGKKKGVSSFTIQEAKDANLTHKDNWKKYPSDMLFARAISRGARRFAPGIFGGSPVYTPDEMDVDVDHEGYVDSTAEVVGDTTVTEPPVFDEPDTEPVQNMMPNWMVGIAIKEGLVENEFSGTRVINLSRELPRDLEQEKHANIVIAWWRRYRENKVSLVDSGIDSKEATKLAAQAADDAYVNYLKQG